MTSYVCVRLITSGGSQSTGKLSDSVLPHDHQGECDQASDLCPGCGRQGRLCQSNKVTQINHLIKEIKVHFNKFRLLGFIAQFKIENKTVGWMK